LKVDSAMDAFIKPLIGFQEKNPDPKEVKAALDKYLESLKLADQNK
jgi:hypothetical protein